MSPDMSGVIYRKGTSERDYDEAITALNDAKRQPGNESTGCTVCWSNDHTAEACHHNPLVMARRAAMAARTWRCFHCDAVFSDAEKAQEHFGFRGLPHPKCRPKIVCICGSSRFVQQCAVKAWELNKQGIATFYMPTLPNWYPGVQAHHQAEAEGVAENLDNLWLGLIELADEVHVMNIGGYIGERTAIEIAHAKKRGKEIVYEVLGT